MSNQSTEDVPPFSRIHAICMYIRNKPCQLCPATERSPYGETVRACRAMADEARNIAVFGNPWGVDAPEEAIRRFREHFNDE